ncbi:MAG: heavy metal translocating P-type ATPase, partial [Gemmatimonadota bacterium]
MLRLPSLAPLSAYFRSGRRATLALSCGASLLAAWLVETLDGPRAAALALYVVAYATGGYATLVPLWRNLRRGRFSIDMLMIGAAMGAAAMGYWEEGAVLLFLFSLAGSLESFALARTSAAIDGLLELRPPIARRLAENGREVDVPIEVLAVGDVIRVRPGERFAADGRVVSGEAAVDQATVTGEAMPVQKGPGATVFTGTGVLDGTLDVALTSVGADTTLARVIALVRQAQGEKARTQRLLDRWEPWYVSGVVAASAAAFLVARGGGLNDGDAFYRAMMLLVAASPCALIISTPASILSAIARGARGGVLFKGGVHLETLGRVRVMAFDKTGTLTTARPTVQLIISLNGDTPAALLARAAAVERLSEHHLARVIEAAAGSCPEMPATEFHSHRGQGVEAVLTGERVCVGNERFLRAAGLEWSPEAEAALERCHAQNLTVVAVGRGAVEGILGIADTERPEAPAALAALRREGITRIVMLTGDSAPVAAALSARLGLDAWEADLTPEEKVGALRALQATYGPVAMVGDGVNDAPALATAGVGIAMGGAGTDIALEAADVVLMADQLDRLPAAVRLARQALAVVRQNLIFATAVI